MSQQGETDRRQEDEWWRQLYGQPDPAGREPGDTLDDRYSSALSALGEEPEGEEPDGGGEAPWRTVPQDTAAPAAPGDTWYLGTDAGTDPGSDAAGEAGGTAADDAGPPDTLRLRRPAPP
ncbi:hypothetical protein PV341_41700, partial [Streptomyces sp. PA03-1a]|nr:hypothetical protein [Streptomyces sp. PA03-1a]